MLEEEKTELNKIINSIKKVGHSKTITMRITDDAVKYVRDKGCSVIRGEETTEILRVRLEGTYLPSRGCKIKR
jgi:hypothetical protein